MTRKKTGQASPSIDLGALQAELKAARSELRSSAKGLASAQARYDAASAVAARTTERLANASRAVLQGEG